MAKKILIIGPSWLGDMIMAQVLFKYLKQQEDCEIDVLAPKWSMPILACMPQEVKSVVEIPFKHGELGLWARYKIGKRLRKRKYDQVIVLPNSWKSALIPFFAKIPLRTGWRGESRWLLLNDIRELDKNELPMMVQRYLALGFPKAKILAKNNEVDSAKSKFNKIKENITSNDQLLPKLKVDAHNVEKVCELFALKDINTDQARPILALCPGAAYGSAKRWPASYYLELALAKANSGWEVWLFGSEQDKPVTKDIEQGLADLANSCHNFAGELSLPQTVALLSLADVVVSNDSGLMHAAASLDRPVISIFGPTSYEHTPPLGKKVKIVSRNMECSPCRQRTCPLGHHKCMRDITPGSILQMVDELMYSL